MLLEALSEPWKERVHEMKFHRNLYSLHGNPHTNAVTAKSCPSKEEGGK